MRLQYKNHSFNKEALDIISRANDIIEEMRGDGYTLTLRQLYYQFVANDLLPNEDRQYKKLGRIITKAREAGAVSWYAIEDRGRECHGRFTGQEEVDEALRGIEGGVYYNPWEYMDTYVEVWVEKQALESVIQRGCDGTSTPYMACKGYLSASEAWRAGMRYAHAIETGKRGVLIHLADHDPSGLDMTRDNDNRVNLFARSNDIEIKRIALNMNQVEEYNPPPNPAKVTDSRAMAYISEYGGESWELDALKPKVIVELVRGEIKKYIDKDEWGRVIIEQDEKREALVKLRENWAEVQDFLETLDE